jgi:hypothetical protein
MPESFERPSTAEAKDEKKKKSLRGRRRATTKS